jgi:hypothetical protein
VRQPHLRRARFSRQETGKGKSTLIGSGLEEDEDVEAALTWFATVSGSPKAFVERLARSQQRYRIVTGSPEHRGRDPSLDVISHDVVGAFLAQAKSLLDDRRSFDPGLASQIVPWVKQIGRNINVLPSIPGATERAARMLRAETVSPDSALFELVMASNYATEDFDVAFIKEEQARTPDFQLSACGLSAPMFVECKRLKRGQYEIQEQEIHKKLFRKTAEVIFERRLSIHMDVTYTQEIQKVPDNYLADCLKRALSSPIITPNGYPWKDKFSSGVVKGANLAAARQDIRESCLYFGTKLARLLCGHAVRENGYHLAVEAKPDKRDPRFIDIIHYGSVVTWQCIAPAAIEKKARFVKTKVVEADRQLRMHGSGIVHLAMDMELQCQSSDLRRALNIESIRAFRASSDLPLIYVHYLVPRISESHTWLMDETVDHFWQGSGQPPSLKIFPAAAAIDNDLPAWRQET